MSYFSTNYLNDYLQIREQTQKLCQPLEIEDYGVQSMEDVSPPKWHLAHTTWFFETFLLKPYLTNYKIFNEKFDYLFNSYYQQLRDHVFPRKQRGLISRPTVKEIYQYRAHIDTHMAMLLDSNALDEKIGERLKIGLAHEQQHQELLLMDIKYNLFHNPSYPAYHELLPPHPNIKEIDTDKWYEFSGDMCTIGADSAAFCFDNELPAHQVYVNPFRIANHLVTNKDYLAFIEDGGYENVVWWLSEAWDYIQKNNWQAPLYWQKIDGKWYQMTLAGLQPIREHEPVSHISYYEANAYANWQGKRLPTETEWEIIASQYPIQGNFQDAGFYHPISNEHARQINHIFGNLWEWTQSAYLPYPGYKSATGAIGEYNGKFMCHQMVLRGGSCATPQSHIRASYRNFFYPKDRWVFSGIRLAESID